MTPAGAAPRVPAVAPLPSTLARATSLTASRSRCDRKAEIAASTRGAGDDASRHRRSLRPGPSAMNGHVATLVGCSSCEARQRDTFFLDVGPSQLPRFEHRLGT